MVSTFSNWKETRKRSGKRINRNSRSSRSIRQGKISSCTNGGRKGYAAEVQSRCI
jgi:hypothetical protein